MKKTFIVEGMTCSACVSHVEKAVGKIPHVKEVNVNLLTKEMIADFEGSGEDIVKACQKAGYNCMEENRQDEVTSVREASGENMKLRLTLSLIFLVLLLYVSMGHMVGMPLPSFLTGSGNAMNFALTQFLLTLPIVYVNRKFFIVGFKNLLTPTMDTLIAIGSSAALVYGVYVMFRISGALGTGDPSSAHKFAMELYFESAGTILALITLGKFLEEKAKGRTTSALKKLVALTPKTAVVLVGGQEVITPFAQIKMGDVVLVKAGERIPIDGKVILGQGEIDNQMVTGESIPVFKKEGDQVVSGGVVSVGVFQIVSEKVGSDTTINQIVQLVKEANSKKAPISKIADKVSGIFVPVVVAISLLTLIGWWIFSKDFTVSLNYAISVLVISCPCALGLATPLAIMVGTGLGAEKGILIKSSESLEQLHKAQVIILDKTGTITKGEPKVVQSYLFDERALDVAYSLEKLSSHPLAESIVSYGKTRNSAQMEVKNFENINGFGVSGEISGEKFFLGSTRFAKGEISKEILERHRGSMLMVLSGSQKVLGIFVLEDVLKEKSKLSIEGMKKLGKHVVILTGDSKDVALKIKEEVKAHAVFYEVTPSGKQDKIIEYQKAGNIVAFVGDGINDSVALTQSDVGISFTNGSDIAVDSSDIVLLSGEIDSVVKAVSLSKKTIKNIKENLLWAFFYNALGIPVAAGLLSFVGISMTPMLASVAMSLSSIFVVLNTLRLRFFSRKLGSVEELVKGAHEKDSFKNGGEIENLFETATKAEKNKTEMKKEIEEDKNENKKGEKVMEIKVSGLMCGHCKMSVEKGLDAKGIKGVVSEDLKILTITDDDNLQKAKDIVKELGYEVED